MTERIFHTDHRSCELARQSVIALLAACALLLAFFGCGTSSKEPAAAPDASKAQPANAADATKIIEQYRATDNSRDSTIRMRAKIDDLNPDAGNTAPPAVEVVMYQKREADGGKRMFIEFTAPAGESDRDALIRVGPQSDVEGTRYAQSSDSFVTSQDVMVEESMFGMTLQEFIGGQPEKYDFKLVGEEVAGSTPVYRLEGTLKQGAESKFHRVVLLISKESFAAVGAEFYDNKNILARVITVSEMKQIGGHWTRMRWTVDNRLRQKKIDFETIEAKYDSNLSDSIFTRDHLKERAKR
jgi:predicted component of type VI protein secretion system